MRWLAALLKSRYVAYLEAEIKRLQDENAQLRDWHAQITSSLLQGAGMPAIDIDKRPSHQVPKKIMAPSIWRKMKEQGSLKQSIQLSKEN